MSAVTVDVYKGSTLLGTGSINTGATSVTSFVANLGRVVKTGRRITCHSRSGSSAKDGHHSSITNGETWRTFVVTDGGATLTLADACPH